jgi:hypothetical protein
MIELYLIGSILYLISAPLIELIFIIINFITGNSILIKNIEKIEKPKNKLTTFLLNYFLSALLSWISLVWLFLATIYRVLDILRSLFRSYPEEINSLRFPLISNPKLSPEQVWANTSAIAIKTGSLYDSSHILQIIDTAIECNEEFDPDKALELLARLNVVEIETINELKLSLRENS